jgi:hypothetical protein
MQAIGEDGGPAIAEGLGERGAHRGACLQAPPGDDAEAGHDQDAQAERRPATGRGHVVLADGQHGGGRQVVEGDERQLVDDQAETERRSGQDGRAAQRHQGQQHAAGGKCRGDQVSDGHGHDE